MSYVSFVYDNTLVEEKQENKKNQTSIEEKENMIAIRFSRKGLAYRKIQKKDYKLTYFSKIAPTLKELKAPSYFPKSDEFAFFRKGIRDGFLYVYCPSDDFWLIFEVNNYKYKLLVGDGSEKADEVVKLIKRKEDRCIYLPEKDEYFVAFSSFAWTEDYINKAVKDRKSEDSIFTSVNIKRWIEAKKKKNPVVLSNAYIFKEDLYELRDLANTDNPYLNITSSVSTDIYEVGEYTARANEYSDKQDALYFTLDDTLGIVEDLKTEIIRFICYKKEFNDAVQRCKPMADSKKDSTDNMDKDLEALYSSAVLLYNMLFSEEGTLNQKDHKSHKSRDGKHKYQSLVQEYKFTKLLAVDARKELQKKYVILRNLLGTIMGSNDYKKEIKTFIGQSKTITLAGQGLLVNHMKVLQVRPDSYDSDIRLKNETEEDRWEDFISQLSLAYLKMTKDKRIKDKNSPLIKLLSEIVYPQDVINERKAVRQSTNPNSMEIVTLSDNSIRSLVFDCMITTATVFVGIADMKLNPIKELSESINKLLDRNTEIISYRTTIIRSLLEKHRVNSPGLAYELYREADSNKRQRLINKAAQNRDVDEIQREVNNAREYKRKALRDRTAQIDDLQVQEMELSTKNKSRTWANVKDFGEGLEKILASINMAFAAKTVIDELNDPNKKADAFDYIYYGLFLFGSSFQVVKNTQLVPLVNESLNGVFKIGAKMKIAKGFFLDLVIFVAECVDSYRILKGRNSETAYYNTISAGLSLLGGACLSIVFVASIPIVGIIILVVAAVGLFVASYFIGMRAKDKEYDLWQSFLVNSIFSNYTEWKFRGDDIDANIIDNQNSKYYEVAQLLYYRREKIAIDNYYYKNKEYNLQNFTEMLRLLDEMATLFDVNVRLNKIDYSYEGTGKYIIPTNLSIGISYYGTTRFNAIDYFFYVDVFPIGNSAGVKPRRMSGISPSSEEEITMDDGQKKVTLTFNVWQILHNIKDALCRDYDSFTELKGKKVLEPMDPEGKEWHIYYPTNMTFSFGCRLVNTNQEDELLKYVLDNTSDQTLPPPNSHAQKRTYLPWKDGDNNIYKGFKCRICIPVPKDKRDFSAWYYREIYTHLVSSVGTLEELQNLELRDIAYEIKDKNN